MPDATIENLQIPFNKLQIVKYSDDDSKTNFFLNSAWKYWTPQPSNYGSPAWGHCPSSQAKNGQGMRQNRKDRWQLENCLNCLLLFWFSSMCLPLWSHDLDVVIFKNVRAGRLATACGEACCIFLHSDPHRNSQRPDVMPLVECSANQKHWPPEILSSQRGFSEISL